MKKIKFIVGILALCIAVFVIFIVLSHEKTLLTHPKGVIARGELHLIVTNILLMLIVVIPTFIFLFVTIWKYRASRSQTQNTRQQSHGVFRELILWIIPAVVVVVMIFVTWKATHKLDPYKSLASNNKPLVIQVVALDWKWLFIYPQQGIASVNYVQFPEKTPVHFTLSADGSPMNSFWLPQLSGQIYAMTGMITPLHVMADETGEYTGRAAEINGKGFADMTFIAKSTTQADFESWVAQVQQSPLHLTDSVYRELVKPSQKNPIAFYGAVEEGLFHKIVMKYMGPTAISWKAPFLED